MVQHTQPKGQTKKVILLHSAVPRDEHRSKEKKQQEDKTGEDNREWGLVPCSPSFVEFVSCMFL